MPNDLNDPALANRGRGMLLQWFPQWWGWYRTNPPAALTNDGQTNNGDSSLIDAPQPKDQNQLEDEILNALSLGSVENNSLLKRDAVFGKFNFTLKKGSLDVATGTPTGSSNKLMLQFQFQNLLLDIESRPRSASHFVGLSLGSVLLKDYLTENSEFPDLIKPQTKDEAMPHMRMQGLRSRSASASILANQTPTTANASTSAEPLFQMHYEQKPLSYNTDYRLLIKSQSLDVVYNMDAIKWIIDFVMKPHQQWNAKKKIEAMKNRTKAELIKNWENMLEGDLSQRQTWTLEIDISAPQIIFVENFNVRNCPVIIVDFGRLKLTNKANSSPHTRSNVSAADTMHREHSEEDEAFVTPCSTPPGSHASASDSPTLCSAISEIPESMHINNDDALDTTTELNEKSLHEKIYERYNMDLTDMQVLVCKSKERWLFASAKGSSTLHVLDRFSIALQVERRIVHTNDPQYPSLTISGTLPKLVAHVNEQKIEAITTMLHTLSTTSLQSPHRSTVEFVEDVIDSFDETATDTTKIPTDLNANANNDAAPHESAKLFVLQFAIDQMSLEVQSRARCLAELQVSGVKAGFSKRPEDTSMSLSVHGLLLVDALQSFGPDFELLIASHRHVGYANLFMHIHFYAQKFWRGEGYCKMSKI